MPAQGGISRRAFLGAGAAGVALVATAPAARALAGPLLVRRERVQLPGPPFTLGIASGDPEPDGVVLWTRLAPDPAAPDGGLSGAPVPVRWEVANDDAFRKVVASGATKARAENAFAVHVDAKGLEPGREYFYRFRAGDEESGVGRTRTAPAPGTGARVRFAIASCQAYQDGLYTAHRHLADEDVHFVAFLGDYIYESGANPAAPRQHEGPEPTELAGYRARYARYKSDPDLQASQAAFPWVVTWDDHEVENNYAGDKAQNLTVAPEEFLRRRAAAYRAWWEHQPVRLPPPDGPDLRIYRRLRFGDLVDLHVLDTRQYRTDQPCASPVDIGAPCEDISARSATLLGDGQQRWLDAGLRRSEARWNVIAQQVMVGRMNFVPSAAEGIFNLDQWDAYEVARRRFVESLAAAGSGPGSTVVLTGDIHTSWVNDITRDFTDADAPTVATEYVGTSITSGFAFGGLVRDALPENPTVRYFDGEHRGYVRIEIDRGAARAAYRYVSSIDTPDTTIETAASFVTEHGRAGATAA